MGVSVLIGCQWARCLTSLLCSALSNRHHGSLVLSREVEEVKGLDSSLVMVGTRCSLQVLPEQAFPDWDCLGTQRKRFSNNVVPSESFLCARMEVPVLTLCPGCSRSLCPWN